MTNPVISPESQYAALDYLRSERRGGLPTVPPLSKEQWLRIAHDCGLLANHSDRLEAFVHAVFAAVPYGTPHPFKAEAFGWISIADHDIRPRGTGAVFIALADGQVTLVSEGGLSPIPGTATHWMPGPRPPGEVGSGKWFSIYQKVVLPRASDRVLLVDHIGNITQGVGSTVHTWAVRAHTQKGACAVMFWRHIPRPPVEILGQQEN